MGCGASSKGKYEGPDKPGSTPAASGGPKDALPGKDGATVPADQAAAAPTPAQADKAPAAATPAAPEPAPAAATKADAAPVAAAAIVATPEAAPSAATKEAAGGALAEQVHVATVDQLQGAIAGLSAEERKKLEAAFGAAPSAADAAPAAAAATVAAPEAAPAAATMEVRIPDVIEADSDEESECDELAEMAFEAKVTLRTDTQGGAGRKSRMAVSSEVVYASDDWKAPVYPKTEEQEERLSKALSKSFMFAALSGTALPQVVKAFQEMQIASGSKVITQDDEVVSELPALFVLETGKLSVYKNGQEGAVFQYSTPGQYFGELALLYNAPRAATVIADEDCTVWSLDRDTFTYLVKDAARIAVKNRIAFLEQVPILKGLQPEEKAKLSDVMNVKVVSKGEYVIKQGEVGTTFYIIESGKLEALKDGEKVLEYNAKDYFGELALLTDAPRAADVVASETSKLLSLDAASFKRIVGSLEEMMKERAGEYGEVTIPS